MTHALWAEEVFSGNGVYFCFGSYQEQIRFFCVIRNLSRQTNHNISFLLFYFLRNIESQIFFRVDLRSYFGIAVIFVFFNVTSFVYKVIFIVVKLVFNLFCTIPLMFIKKINILWWLILTTFVLLSISVFWLLYSRGRLWNDILHRVRLHYN